MEFAFFYPLAWLGAAAIGVPVWLHLHRRRESNLILFSALRFLDDQPIARRRPLWPRDLLLLLLRILGLLLIIAAFAFPYLPSKESPKLITESVVYILDNTLSHQAQGKFAAAREQLADQLEAAPPGRQTAVVVLDSAPRVLGDFSDQPRDVAAIVRKQKSLQPTFARGSYVAAFRQADQLLRQSLGEERRIVLYVDQQANQWEEGRQSPPFLKDVQVDFAESSASRLANVAVWQPKAQRIRIGDESLVECSFRLYHQGAAEKVDVQIFDGDGLVGQREIVVKGEPEEMSLAFEWPIEATQWLQGRIHVSAEHNVLAGDDDAVFSLAPRRPGSVQVLGKSLYLRTALAPDVMQDRWETRWLEPQELSNSKQFAEVLCIETSNLESREVRDYAMAHLNDGRGLVLFIDELPAGSTPFLRQLDIEPSSTVTTSRDARIRYYYSEHPLFANFRSGQFGDLLDVRVERYRLLESSRAVPLMFAHDGEPIIMEVPAKGPLLVFGFSLDRRDTNWPIHTSFIPFLDLCLQHVRPQPPTVESFVPGEACTWNVPQGLDVSAVIVKSARLLDADESRLKSAVASANPLRVPVNQGQAKFVVPQIPGLYGLFYDSNEEPAAMLQVNCSPAESDLTYTDPKETIAGWQIPKQAARPEQQIASVAPTSEASILRQQIWWWLLLSGLTMLAAESAWLALRKDRR